MFVNATYNIKKFFIVKAFLKINNIKYAGKNIWVMSYGCAIKKEALKTYALKL